MSNKLGIILPEEERAFYELWPISYWREHGNAEREGIAKAWWIRGRRNGQETMMPYAWEVFSGGSSFMRYTMYHDESPTDDAGLLYEKAERRPDLDRTPARRPRG